MPRSKSSRPSRPRTAPAVMRPPPPPPPPPPAVQQSAQPGMMRGIGGAIAEGMAFGGGSAVAHRAIDAVIGPRTVHHEVTQATSTAAPGATPSAGQSQEPDVCVNQAKAFKDCLKANANDIGKCQFYVDMLTQCRKSAGIETPQSFN